MGVRMAGVLVKPVRSWLDRRRFLDLPWSLYRNDPNWIPPLRRNAAELLNYRRHPFYDNAEIQTFLAYRDGQIVGRIAAIINRPHNQRYHEQRGFFGFFESVDDRAVSDALFDAARAWLTERGMTTFRGPANPSMNYECGLLTRGFDSPPTFMMTYNPAYYVPLVEGYGFKKGHDLYAYSGNRGELPKVDERMLGISETALNFSNATIRSISVKNFDHDVDLFIDLYNASLIVNWGFVPLEPPEMRKLAESMRHLLIPQLTTFAEVEGRAVGAVFGMPDYNPRIKKINGRLFPFGVFTLLSKKKDFKRIRVISINVVPEYQKWGLGLSLMLSLVPKALEMNVQEGEFSWISEDNELARKGLEKCGIRVTKEFRMYDLDGK